MDNVEKKVIELRNYSSEEIYRSVIAESVEFLKKQVYIDKIVEHDYTDSAGKYYIDIYYNSKYNKK